MKMTTDDLVTCIRVWLHDEHHANIVQESSDVVYIDGEIDIRALAKAISTNIEWHQECYDE
jgi:hypothetical protein